MTILVKNFKFVWKRHQIAVETSLHNLRYPIYKTKDFYIYKQGSFELNMINYR